MGTKSNATSASDRGAGVNRTGADLVAAGDIGDPPLDAFDDVLASPPPPPLVVLCRLDCLLRVCAGRVGSSTAGPWDDCLD
jgi:hypothetical protein